MSNVIHRLDGSTSFSAGYKRLVEAQARTIASSKRKYQREIYKLFGSGLVVYHPQIAIKLKSVKAAILLAQLLYWHTRGNDEVWIYKTVNEFREETGLSRAEQDTAIRILKKFGIVEVKRKKIPQTRHFKTNLDAVKNLLNIGKKADV
jgi:hypothetical protein